MASINKRHSTSLLQRAFLSVRRIGRTLPGVEATTRYDGCPALTFRGCFLAALADPRWAEPGTLVIRATLPERELMIADAPDTYYMTDHHRPQDTNRAGACLIAHKCSSHTYTCQL